MTDTETCCGKTVSTPHCPMCGKRARYYATLHTLLAHCRGVANPQEKMAAHWERTHPDSSRTKLKRQTADKWRTWCELLEEVIAERDKENQ